VFPTIQHHVKSGNSRDGSVNELLGEVLSSHITSNSDSLSSSSLDLLNDSLGLLCAKKNGRASVVDSPEREREQRTGIEVGDDDLGSLGSEEEGGGTSDTLGSTGDDSDLTANGEGSMG
jgi:hypothetical protein